MVRRDGYRDVFITTLAAEGTLAGAAMVLALGVLLLNLRVALRTLSTRELALVTREGPIAITVDRRHVQTIGTALAVVVALLFGVYAAGQWQVAAVSTRAALRRRGPGARQGREFLHPASVPGRDPRLSICPGRALLVVTGRVRGRRCGGRRYEARPADCRIGEATLAVLAAAMLLVLAFGAYLDVPRLLTTQAVIHGAANVDVAFRIPALRVLMIAALAGVALARTQLAVASWWPISPQRACTSPWPSRIGGGGDAPIRRRAERAGP